MTAANQRAAFIRAICEYPFDDGPRLQYADWLLENGHEDDGWYLIRSLRDGGRGEVLLPDIYYCEANQWLEHGSEVVTRWPVVEVEITDKKPWLHISNSYAACWGTSSRDSLESDQIPTAWFDSLTGEASLIYRPSRQYSTTAEAYADLSRVCIDWARAEAKLSKLDWSKKR